MKASRKTTIVIYLKGTNAKITAKNTSNRATLSVACKKTKRLNVNKPSLKKKRVRGKKKKKKKKKKKRVLINFNLIKRKKNEQTYRSRLLFIWKAEGPNKVFNWLVCVGKLNTQDVI